MQAPLIMINIAVIDNYDSFVFNLVRYINQYPNTQTHVMKNDQIDYDLLNSSDAIVLSPGPGTPENSGDLIHVIECYHAQKPILGVCLGHQAMGIYFGAQLNLSTKILHGVQSEINLCCDSKLFTSLPDRIQVGRYHSWILTHPLPDSLRITSETASGEIMSFEHRELPIYGVQFHPESILTPAGRTIIINFLHCVKTIQLHAKQLQTHE